MNIEYYKADDVRMIQIVYLLAMIFWIVLIWSYGLLPGKDGIESIILWTPIVIFLVSYISAPYVTNRVENYMFKVNLLTLGLLVALPVINWMDNNSHSERVMFAKLISTAIIMSVVGLVDIWIPDEYLVPLKHAKSALQTAAIIILTFTLYRFFIEYAKPKQCLVSEDMKLSPDSNKSQKTTIDPNVVDDSGGPNAVGEMVHLA